MFWSKRFKAIDQQLLMLSGRVGQAELRERVAREYAQRLAEATAVFMAQTCPAGVNEKLAEIVRPAADPQVLRDLAVLGTDRNGFESGTGLLASAVRLLATSGGVALGVPDKASDDASRVALLAAVVVEVARIADHFDVSLRDVFDGAAKGGV